MAQQRIRIEDELADAREEVSALREAIDELHKRLNAETGKRAWCALAGIVAGLLIANAWFGP